MMRTVTKRYPYFTTDWLHWPMPEFFRPMESNAAAIETEVARIELVITGNINRKEINCPGEITGLFIHENSNYESHCLD